MMDYLALHMLEGPRKSREEGGGRGRRDEGGRGRGGVGWVGRHTVLDVVAISKAMTLVVHHHKSVYAMV